MESLVMTICIFAAFILVHVYRSAQKSLEDQVLKFALRVIYTTGERQDYGDFMHDDTQKQITLPVGAKITEVWLAHWEGILPQLHIIGRAQDKVVKFHLVSLRSEWSSDFQGEFNYVSACRLILGETCANVSDQDCEGLTVMPQSGRRTLNIIWAPL